jgi:hypothetical protein
VDALLTLLPTAPSSWAWQVQEQLIRIASDSAPLVPTGEGAAGYRKKLAASWTAWWLTHAPQIDLAALQRQERFEGAFTITELDFEGKAKGPGRIWECGRDGQERWQVGNLGGAMDGQLLSSGHILVAEGNFNRVAEKDKQGNIVWNVPTPSTPVAVMRLPNGNTFIAMYNHVMEMKPDKSPVYTVARGPQVFIYGASRMRIGHIALITSQGQIVEFDPVGLRDVKTINLGQPNGWAGVDALPNGRFLVALMNLNEIREIDEAGRTHWRANFSGAFRALKLPNGNVLACGMTNRRVAELDRSGREVWGVTCQGRPWNLRAR